MTTSPKYVRIRTTLVDGLLLMGISGILAFSYNINNKIEFLMVERAHAIDKNKEQDDEIKKLNEIVFEKPAELKLQNYSKHEKLN